MGIKRHVFVLTCAALALLLLCSCQIAAPEQTTAAAQAAEPDRTEAALEAVNAQAARVSAHGGTAEGSGVPVSRMVSRCDNGYIVYPHVAGGASAGAVNAATVACVEACAAQHDCMVFTEYKVEYNKNGVLSFRMMLYDLYGEDSAALQVIPLTFDVRTGKLCGIADLFEGADERWRGILPEIVAAQAEKRTMTLLNDLLPIGDAQQYYISSGGVVLMYHVYEIATFDAGAPEFVIPVTQLAEFIGEDSPLVAALAAAQAGGEAKGAAGKTAKESAAREVS